jgi:hypothetical protein
MQYYKAKKEENYKKYEISMLYPVVLKNKYNLLKKEIFKFIHKRNERY